MNKTMGNRQVILASLRKHIHKESRYLRVALLLNFGQAIAKACGLTAYGQDAILYPKLGETVSVYLAESHLIFETYPEHDLIELEIVSCQTFDFDKAKHILENAGYELLGITKLLKKGHKWQPC